MNVHPLREKRKSSNLEVQCSLVGKICFVSSQSYDNIRTGLPLKLFNPIFCTCKWFLKQKNTTQKDIRQHFLNNHAALLSITRAFMSALCLQASQLHTKCANVWGKPCNLWVISSANSLHLWCRTPRWLPELLCNTSEPNCGNVPDQLCPRSQTSLSCHPNILSESGKPLGVGRGQAKQTNKQNRWSQIPVAVFPVYI